MKEVREFNKSYILISALYIVLGIVFLAMPGLSVQMICYLLGISMLVIGITYIVLFFTRDSVRGILSMDLVIGIVAAAFGAFVLLNQTFIGTILPFAMGIVLLLGAVIKLQNAISMKRLKLKPWYVVLIFSVILAALGAILLVNPFPEEHQDWMIMYTGISLILDGVVNLVSMGFILGRVKKIARLQKQYPDRKIGPDDLLTPPPAFKEEIIQEAVKPESPIEAEAAPQRPALPPMRPEEVPEQQKDESYQWAEESYDWTKHPERWKENGK